MIATFMFKVERSQFTDRELGYLCQAELKAELDGRFDAEATSFATAKRSFRDHYKLVSSMVIELNTSLFNERIRLIYDAWLVRYLSHKSTNVCSGD